MEGVGRQLNPARRLLSGARGWCLSLHVPGALSTSHRDAEVIEDDGRGGGEREQRKRRWVKGRIKVKPGGGWWEERGGPRTRIKAQVVVEQTRMFTGM